MHVVLNFGSSGGGKRVVTMLTNTSEGLRQAAAATGPILHLVLNSGSICVCKQKVSP